MSRRRERYWAHSDPTPTERAYTEHTSDPCPGPCNRHWRQAENLATPEHPNELRPHPGAPIWCYSCQATIVHNLNRIPRLAAAIRARLDGRLNIGSGQTDTTRTTTRTGSPSGSPAWDTVEEAAAWVGDWVDQLAEHLHHAHRGGTSEHRVHNLTANIRYLTAHITALLCSPIAVETGHGATTTAARLERAAGQDALVHRLPAPCPSCDRVALTRDDGAEQVACQSCGRVWVEDDYRRLTLILASEAEAG